MEARAVAIRLGRWGRVSRWARSTRWMRLTRWLIWDDVLLALMAAFAGASFLLVLWHAARISV